MSMVYTLLLHYSEKTSNISSVYRSLKRLEDMGVIRKIDGSYRLIDPVFGLWLKRNVIMMGG